MMASRPMLLFLGLVSVACVTATAPVEAEPHEYISYIRGDYPLIITVPNGGYLTPESIPDRQNGCSRGHTCHYTHTCGRPSTWCDVITSRDAHTREIGQQIWREIRRLTGRTPHLIINELHRRKLDVDQERDVATFDVVDAIHAYGNYTLYVQTARTVAGLTGDGRALLIDVHGHSHDSEAVELGYLLRGTDLDRRRDDAVRSGMTSINNLLDRVCSTTACRWDTVSGGGSLGAMLAVSLSQSDNLQDLAVVPSPSNPGPGGAQFTAGSRTVETHGSKLCGQIDGIRLGLPRSVRYVNWEEFSTHAAKALVAFLEEHQYQQYYQ